MTSGTLTGRLTAILRLDAAPPPDVLAGLSEADWEGLLALAFDQRVAALLYYRLQGATLEPALPDPIRTRLAQHYRRTALHNISLLHELSELVRALRAESIPVVALKGIYLAACVYDDIALREMDDIDLLVPQDSLEQAAGIAQSLGYEPWFSLNIPARVAVSQHLSRLFKRRAASVELHWNLTKPNQRYTISPTPLWQRSIQTEMGGLAVSRLSTTDLLLHLCLHTSYQHQFAFGLRPSCDIAWVIARLGEEIDWGQLVQRATEWNWQRGVYLALSLACALAGAAVPEWVLRSLEPPDCDPVLVQAAQEQIFTDNETRRSLSVNLAQTWEADGMKAKVAAFVRSVWLPKEHMAYIYHLPIESRRVYLYYPVRLLTVIVRDSRKAWRLWRADGALGSFAQRRAYLATWLQR